MIMLQLTWNRSYCWRVYLPVSWMAVDQLDCVDWVWYLVCLDGLGERNIRACPASTTDQENAERHRR